MIKTSVYLTEELKDELAGLARTSGISEAELIRKAVENHVHSARATGNAAVARRWPEAACVLAVGVGPGDPSLITDEARAALQSAARIFVMASGPGVVSRAEMVVRSVLPNAPVTRLPIDVYNAKGEVDYEPAADALLDEVAAGRVVAVAVLGDPNVFSVIAPLTNALGDAATKRDAAMPPVVSISGITTFQQLAAHAGLTLAESHETLVVLPPNFDRDELAAALDSSTNTIVVCKGGRSVPVLVDALEHAKREGAVIGEQLGLPGGRFVAVADYDNGEMSYLASVIVPAERKNQ